MFLGRLWRWVIYSRDVASASAPVAGRGWEFRPLTADELRAPSGPIGPFETRQIERLERFGRSYAFGVFIEGQLAHVAWMLAHPADQLDSPRLLALAEGEAEITACETVAAFRGRGIYPFAIRSLWMVAKEQGIHRVFMKTAASNRASRIGMQKAGLTQVATVFVWNPPWDRSRSMVIRRGPIRLAK